jgi:hypothetical protein
VLRAHPAVGFWTGLATSPHDKRIVAVGTGADGELLGQVDRRDQNEFRLTGPLGRRERSEDDVSFAEPGFAGDAKSGRAALTAIGEPGSSFGEVGVDLQSEDLRRMSTLEALWKWGWDVRRRLDRRRPGLSVHRGDSL